MDALQLDRAPDVSLASYKKAFTPAAVRKIYEAIVDLWPPNTDVQQLLERASADVSGLYIGDYNPAYVSRAIVRHSIYANKILLVDPFMHPYVTSNEFNPILNPAQHRAQTLKNVNFYMSVLPWIEAGIVEFIRTPADFDRKLNYDALERAGLAAQNEKIKAAVAADVEDLHSRHFKSQAIHFMILSMPDSALRKRFRDLPQKEGSEFTEDDFINYINAQRESDRDFLEPLGTSGGGQLHMSFSGGFYEMASLSAHMTGSYLFTDLRSRWAMIEEDRSQSGNSSEIEVWSPFAKAIQNTKLNYLNNLGLEHALKLREEGRLETLRAFLTRVWHKARGDEPFNEAAAIHLASELTAAVDEADAEWNQIKKDLVKIVGGAASAGALSAGPVIASGHALWLAGAAAMGAASVSIWSSFQRRAYLKRHPAAFFMDLRDEEA